MKNTAITDRFHRTDRAVSPVIGVILMVAITVILAAVIGTFVLDLGQSAGNQAPSASLVVDTSGNNVTISHQGGDSLTDGNTRIVLTNESDGDEITLAPGDTQDTYSVGDELQIDVVAGDMSGSDVFGARSVGSNWADINSGTQYSVQIIDTESQRIIFETTVTA